MLYDFSRNHLGSIIPGNFGLLSLHTELASRTCRTADMGRQSPFS